MRDILSILRRRFDGLAVTIYPVRVQGEVAAAEIAAGIRALQPRGGFDVLIVARGGGSARGPGAASTTSGSRGRSPLRDPDDLGGRARDGL